MRKKVRALTHCISLLAALSLFQGDPLVDMVAAEKRELSKSTAASKRPRCRDKRDNDADGRVDFPADPGCRNKNDNSESPDLKVSPLPPSTRPGGEGINIGTGVSLEGRRAFPSDNPWNQDISQAPIDPHSDALISSIGLTTGLHPDFGTIWEGAPIGIPYMVVPGDQPKVGVTFDYESESDQGPYPIPLSPAIEGGEHGTGDRHIILIDRDNWKLYELFSARFFNGKWHAGSGAIFDLSSNDLRPLGWTSADAAGLPIFPGLVRYDEVMEQGEILHALRFTAQRTRKGFVHPARHHAGSSSNSLLPPMGMRVRLKADFDVSSFPEPVRVILRALKRYGMLLADNGSNWFVTGAPNSRWDDDTLATLRRVQGRDFEVIQMGEVIED